MPSGDKTPIRHPFPCPTCGGQTRIWGGRHTVNGLQYRYRDCHCGARFTTVQNGHDEQFHSELERQKRVAMPAISIESQRRALYNLVRENFRLRKVFGLPLTVGCEPEHYELAAKLRERKAA